MAKKEEIEIVRPSVALRSLTAYSDAVILLCAVVTQVQDMMADTTLDAKKVCATLAPHLKEALARVEKYTHHE